MASFDLKQPSMHVGSDELASQSRIVLLESRLAVSSRCQCHDSLGQSSARFPELLYFAAKEGHRNSAGRSVIALY